MHAKCKTTLYSWAVSILLIFMTSIIATSSFAQEYDKRYTNLTKHYTRPPQISREIQDILNNTYRIATNDIDKALTLLSDLDVEKLNLDEQGLLYMLRGMLLSRQKKYARSITSYENSIYQKSLYFSANKTTLFTLGQQSYFIKDYNKTIKYFNNWLTFNRNPPADLCLMLGEAYFFMGNNDLAMEYLRLAKKRRPIKKNLHNQIIQTLEKVKQSIERSENNLDGTSDNISRTKRSYWPVLKIAPIYPNEAVKNNIQGYVILTYDISHKGYPKNIKIKESTNPLFNRSAIQSTKRSKYILSEKTKDKIFVRGITSKVSFKLE